ncbi:MAG: eukaryotic translation initiation factor 4E binding protein 2-like protein [Linnemannia elongata]|nr:MAG: eukaryotic translation initiation factor 4E binding protein 2-like protein [Linnemannia elongata]
MSTNSRAIPLPSRRAEPGTPIPLDYGTTPGGTIYSSTPGGTRIIYDRNTLLSLRNSPLSRTPPAKLAFVAGAQEEEDAKGKSKRGISWRHNVPRDRFQGDQGRTAFRHGYGVKV